MGSASVTSPMAGNGHNASFDGRIFISRRGNDDASGGWFLQVLRPERAIEQVGCPACHATSAELAQTRPDRTFSPFDAKELVARAAHLIELAEGRAEPPPHGPLQPTPVLPP